MSSSASSWLVIVLAVLAANLPFLNERCFALVAIQRFVISKPLWVRLLELITLYFCVGVIAYALEAGAGNSFSQGWEFYAINACLFLVLAFPGFVYRYMRRRHD
ncbi:DUF2818 family protein [Undibacterium sp. TJN19]|uniref:DUF2818 family protein n=1 Tax=Undibacterium sp. TJN19 TaxID=3413055 RepID=UPI003BF06742